MLRLKSCKIFFLFLLFPLMVKAQSPTPGSDEDLMRNHSFENHRFHHHPAPFMLVHSRNWLLCYNPVSLGLGSAMYFYQNVISRQFSAGCLYSPSCSEYSKKLILDFGLVKGLFLTADRISRCNRISATDIRPSQVDPLSRKVTESTQIYRIRK